MFRYFAGLASELKGETVPLSHELLSLTQREPLGVVAAVIPWNAPFSLATVKIAPALCAGNTMVMKTAEDAPLAVMMLAEICARFLPRGVLNMLTGTGPECGSALLNHGDISKISFTGSTAVGKLAMEAAAKRILPVSLELGGKSPSIVFDDADDDDWVVEGVISAAEPVLHRRVAPLPSSEDLRPFPRSPRYRRQQVPRRRPSLRGDRHRRHHQRAPVQQGLQLR
jgi:acyl-CoA reductase-like NAD-dependent aldehyde dehydrogenase